MASGTEVQLQTGRVAGTSSDGVRRFAGIPYGAAPRFGRPAPATGWTGVRDCTQFGPVAWQPRGGPALVPGLEPPGEMSEDCLTATVWSPHGAESLPVLVWVHGGSFLTGAPSLAVYDATRLAARGAVVVSVAYRLGPLGFVSFDGLGGRERGWVANAGLHDVALALEWVRANAAAFGGDPRRVTVFGESAGGGVILHLLGAPRRAQLFDAAIVQSGSAGRTFDADSAGLVADRLVKQVGGSLDAIATAAPAELVAAVGGVMGDPDVFARAGMMPFHPCLDGELVARAPAAAIADGAARGCDLVLGVTRDEMALFLEAPSIERPRLRKRVSRYAGTDLDAADGLIDAYASVLAREGRRADPIDVWAAIYSDREMVLPARAVLDGASRHHPATFGYLFTWTAPPRAGSGIPLGAAHAFDLPFTFGTFDADGWGEFVGATGTRAAGAGRLSDTIQREWLTFAARGRPTWPAYDATKRPMLQLDAESRVVDDPLADRAAPWAGVA